MVNVGDGIELGVEVWLGDLGLGDGVTLGEGIGVATGGVLAEGEEPTEHPTRYNSVTAKPAQETIRLK